MFTEGKLFHKVGEGSGGGGGDQHNLGWYATSSDLQTAHPTASAGDWAIVGATDTVWVWDTDTSAWVDTDTKGQVTSVNGATGDVTVQATLVSGTNIKSVNNNSLLGAGNLELSTYLTYPAGWTTNSTTVAFCADIAADSSAVKGKAYLGEVTINDLPASMANGEIVVEIMDGTTAADKVIKLTLSSGNVSPYMWVYTYWNNGSNTSGWQTWQEPLVSGTNIKTVNGTTLLGSGDIATEVIQVSSMPTAAVGELGKVYQFIGTTDANYTHGYFYECVSDGATPPVYSWSNVQVQASSGGLPSQTGNSGKFLTTDGTSPSWSDKPLVNNATDTTSLSIGGTIGASNVRSVVVGQNAKTTANWATVIGAMAESLASDTVSIGYGTIQSGGRYSIGIGTFGSGMYAGINAQYSIAIVTKVASGSELLAHDTIVLGTVYSLSGLNNNTFYVGLGLTNSQTYELLSSDGTIPTARLTKVNTTVTLTAAGWSGGSQTVTVTGMTATGIALVSPDPTDQSAYTSAGIICTAQAADSLTFTCSTTPTGDIDVVVVML